MTIGRPACGIADLGVKDSVDCQRVADVELTVRVWPESALSVDEARDRTVGICSEHLDALRAGKSQVINV